MAIDLSIIYEQSNDATYLTATDNTGTYEATCNPYGWGTPNIDLSDVVTGTDDFTPGKYHIKLYVTFTNKQNETVTYTTIDLFDHKFPTGGAFTSANELTWDLYASDLLYDSTPQGTSDELLQNGVYTLKYTVEDNITHTAESEFEIVALIDGAVRLDVYDALREISRQYADEINDESREIMDTLLKYAYLRSMNAAVSVSRTDELTSMLWTLNKLNRDGSKYSW